MGKHKKRVDDMENKSLEESSVVGEEEPLVTEDKPSVPDVEPPKEEKEEPKPKPEKVIKEEPAKVEGPLIIVDRWSKIKYSDTRLAFMAVEKINNKNKLRKLSVEQWDGLFEEFMNKPIY